MKRIGLQSEISRGKFLLMLLGLLTFLLASLPAAAKTATDFNPNLNFSEFKTFAYIGGVEQLARMPLNPDQIKNQIHRAVVRELTAKGLREVQPEENPDLVVRYYLESETNGHMTGTANWATYGNYYYGHWSVMYLSMDPVVTHQGTLNIELINAKTRDLAWRLFASERVVRTTPEKIAKTMDGNIKKAFKEYPPSPRAIEEKKKEWAKEVPEKKPS